MKMYNYIMKEEKDEFLDNFRYYGTLYKKYK